MASNSTRPLRILDRCARLDATQSVVYNHARQAVISSLAHIPMFAPLLALLKPTTIPRSNRPWLLLWLLPYLVFSVASEGFHAHDLVPPGKQITAQGRASHSHASLKAIAAPTTTAECFACDWAASSASYLATTTPLAVTRSVTVTPTSFQFSLQAFPASLWHNRGPPLA